MIWKLFLFESVVSLKKNYFFSMEPWNIILIHDCTEKFYDIVNMWVFMEYMGIDDSINPHQIDPPGCLRFICM